MPSIPWSKRSASVRQASTTAANNELAVEAAPDAAKLPPPSASYSSTPISPRSPINANKPLPSPPPPGSSLAEGPPPKPVLKLARIMATLSDSDIEKLFSGAPQYFARSEGHNTGAPHPSVAFPWDEEVGIRDLADHIQVEDHAWRCMTAWPHITRGARRNSNASATTGGLDRARAHFYPRCRERPNMLSMLGLEKGTIGYQAALEMSVSDALQEEQYGFGSLGFKAHLILDQRQKLVSSKDGLRRLKEDFVLDQLSKNGRRYNSGILTKDMSSELYNDLFLHILHPPNRIIDHGDPYSLAVQIQALLKVLTTPNVWLDFSRVEWRLRLGQVLWGTLEGDEVADGTAIADADTMGECIHERYWLLLQVLLACELLIRLDAITSGEELGVESIHPDDIRRFERDANATVKWSLILARVWLDNIEVRKSEPDSAPPNHASTGWLASLTERMTLHSHRHTKSRDMEEPATYTVKGVHGERQINGLTHFARKLQWPNIESYEARITDNARTVNHSSPVSGSPRDSTHARRTSVSSLPKTPTLKKGLRLRRRKVGAMLNPNGWLSKSYISSLVLPGESVSHLLMATLLENDKEAMAKLGPMANLAGGFIYRGKSFWSTNCVVGRVLAAGNGSAECMGWISSDVMPTEVQDGWVDITVEETPAATQRTGRKARLWDKVNVEKDSDVLGNADPSSVFPADFIIPTENNYLEPLGIVGIELQSLSLSAARDSFDTLAGEENGFAADVARHKINTYSSSLSFIATRDGEETEHTFSLSRDVYFVTAHPCAPSQYVKYVKSPSSPTIQQIDVSGEDVPGKISTVASVTGHPLHKSFTYTVIHLSELLRRRSEPLESLLQNTPARRPSLTPTQNTTTMPRVLVIDCVTNFPRTPPQSTPTSPLSATPPLGSLHGVAAEKMHLESRARRFGSDVEILARAICAEMGWDAVISRRRRGCLGCAIREAGALDWRVVIRL
ncbi:uncharacterized protein DNG_02881 [Cephalotrichum gorgonifer]|uniref:Helicase-like protein n=1 Tax=Cephalotrichum gorgonifer TaxID=2041049 RepID=A0AAE8ST46_9PEZI|nr:uncharacterized protein DNG_02881 [Cephalotrichum gorgonifer]